MSASSKESRMFTDDEIYAELKKLGYGDISPELFRLLKEDLADMLLKEEKNGTSSSYVEESSLFSDSSSDSYLSSPERDKHRAGKMPLHAHRLGESSSDKENESAISGASSERMIKRKVLRHRDGKSFVTEELRPVPNYSNTSDRENRSSVTANSRAGMSLRIRSSSSENLSWQRLSSASSSNLSSSSSSSRKNSSQSRHSSVILPNLNVKPKKCDPVRRYHEYKKYWEVFKTPGEKKHQQLRWTIRERMLDYDFA